LVVTRFRTAEKTQKPYLNLWQEGKPSNFVLSYIFPREARKTTVFARFCAEMLGMRENNSVL
jgi:hypothetical protein